MCSAAEPIPATLLLDTNAMDGDLRARWRRPSALPFSGESWGYSSTLPSDVVDPQWVRPNADVSPRIEPPVPRTRPQPADDERPAKTDEKADAASADKPAAPAKKPMPRGKKILYLAIAFIIVAAVIVAGVLYWLHAQHFENTDDAFIDGHISQISAQVAARVTRLDIVDNQEVTKGQVLLQLDPRDYQVKLEQAQAQRAQAAAQVLQAQAQVTVQQANLDQAQAQVQVADADLGQQTADLKRYKAIDPRAITRQQLDTSSAQTRSATAKVDAAKQAVEGARATIEAQKAMVTAAQASLQGADAAVDSAKLQLSYATVVAPDSGRITKRTVEVGNYVSAGQSLLAIVPDQLWVTANFKETQLASMKPGQKVAIGVDACPDKTIEGTVQSFQSGTGSVFSSLPAENATGNYVKVVQRVPVKIVFDHAPEGCHLSPGMSVEPQVTVR